MTLLLIRAWLSMGKRSATFCPLVAIGEDDGLMSGVMEHSQSSRFMRSMSKSDTYEAIKGRT